jgi:hypothetical protein
MSNPRWPIWKIIVAYAVLAVAAGAAIWGVDRRASVEAGVNALSR